MRSINFVMLPASWSRLRWRSSQIASFVLVDFDEYYFDFICDDGSCVCVCASLAEVEKSGFCTSVLRARQADGLLPACKIVDDVRDYKPTGCSLEAEVLSGGFPCQATTLEIFDVELNCCESGEVGCHQSLLALRA